MEDYKVFITRHPQDYEGGAIPITKITGLKWDDQSGGVGKRHGGYCLYGYIDYNLAAKTVRCSGEHEGYPNTTVCNSLKTLIRNQKITMEGSFYSPYQKF